MVNKSKRPDRQVLEAPPTLEQRIVHALRRNDIPSSELDALIAETEAEVGSAGQEIAELRRKMLDLQESPDPAEAQRRLAMAELHSDRLETVLPRLRDHLNRALAAEQHAEWQCEFEELSLAFAPLADQLDELDKRIGAIEKERRKLNRRALAYNDAADEINRRADQLREERRLPTLELSVPAGVVDDAHNQCGPPKVDAELALAVVQSMALPYCPGPRWSEPEVQEQRRIEIEESQAQIARCHEKQTRDQEARQNEEERKHYAARRR